MTDENTLQLINGPSNFEINTPIPSPPLLRRGLPLLKWYAVGKYENGEWWIVWEAEISLLTAVITGSDYDLSYYL